MPAKPIINKFRSKKLVDEITNLNAKIAILQMDVEAKKEALIKFAGTNVIALGTKTKANITHCDGRKSSDDELKEKIKELIERHLSVEYVEAHTKKGEDYDQIRIYDL